MEMLGQRMTAMQLQSLGVVNRVVPHEQLDSTVSEIAVELAKKSPVAMRLGRDSFYRHQDMDFRAALHYLHGQFLLVSRPRTRARASKRSSKSAIRTSKGAELSFRHRELREQALKGGTGHLPQPRQQHKP